MLFERAKRFLYTVDFHIILSSAFSVKRKPAFFRAIAYRLCATRNLGYVGADIIRPR